MPKRNHDKPSIRRLVKRLNGWSSIDVFEAAKELQQTDDLCRAYIQSEDGGGIADSELDAVLNDLAPDQIRGKYKLGTFLDIICMKLQKPANAGPSSEPELTVDPCAPMFWCFGGLREGKHHEVRQHERIQLCVG
jgi:hypothetical protein